MIRVAVVYYGETKERKLRSLAQALAKGVEKQGHQVDVINGKKETQRVLTPYKYIVFGTEVLSWWKGRIPRGVAEYLSQSGIVTGKRCCAFVNKRLGSERGLKNLMRAMEHEGMMLHYSEIFSNEEEAEMIGKIIEVERS